MSFPSELAAAVVTIEEGKKALRSLARGDEQRRREIKEDADLTTEGRAIARRHQRQQVEKQQREIRGKIEKARERADRIRQQTHVHRPGIEDGRARARRLLEQGYAFDVLLARADKYGDDELAAGLQAELPYLGDGDKFADEVTDIDGLAKECDRVLARIARHSSERDTSRLLLEIAEASRGIEQLEEFTAKSIRGEAKPTDRLKLAYALGPDQQGEPYREER